VKVLMTSVCNHPAGRVSRLMPGGFPRFS